MIDGQTPISEAGLSVRSTNALLLLFETVADVRVAWLRYGRRHFKNLPNVGIKSVNEMCSKLDLKPPGPTNQEYQAALAIVEAYEAGHKKEAPYVNL